MTDLHTHILPEIDDGSPNVQTSLAMLQMQSQQGVDAVALTPHYCPGSERAEQFLQRRKESYDLLCRHIETLSESEQSALPQMILGAEVAWVPGISEWPELPELCYEGSKMILLELPFHRWDRQLFRELNEMMNSRALTPVIAHIDRYFGLQNHKQLLQLFGLGVPIQISAAALSVPFVKRIAWRILKEGRTDLLISDCHDLELRRPNLGTAYQQVKEKLGEAFSENLKECSDILFTESEEQGEEDEPV